MRNLIVIFFLVCVTLVLSGCRKERETPSWDTEVLMPLVKSTLNINDLIADSLKQTQNDSSITIVYKNRLYQLNTDSILMLPNKTFTKSFKLESIKIGTPSITIPVSLGKVLGFYGAFIKNGSSVVVPNINGINSGSIDVNAQQLFQSVTLISGDMDITVKNNFPFDIKNVAFQLNNNSNSALIVRDAFSYIAAGSSQTKTVSLAGKTIEGNLVARINNMDIVGTGSAVLIDTSDQLLITTKLKNLKPFTATAIFPAQSLVNITENLPLDAGGVELTEDVVKSGFVKVEVFSTLQDTLHFHYTIPGAKLNGNSFVSDNKIPPAPADGVSKFLKLYDFSGYHLDLKGKNADTINSIYHSIIGSIDSTGIIKTISLNDSFYVNVEFINILPEYAKGYLGQKTFNIGSGASSIDIFNKITGGSLNLKDIKLIFSIENGIGADAEIIVNKIVSVNSKKKTSVLLNSSALINNPISLKRAIEFPYSTSTTTIPLNTANSNASALIENLPDQFNYSLKVNTNPNGNVFAPERNDFMYADKTTLNANLDIEIPLSIAANDLTLSDTTFINFDNIRDKNKIKDGTFILFTDNGFPFNVTVQLYLLNENNTITDSLLTSTNTVDAAFVDANYKVTTKKSTQLKIPVTASKMKAILNTKKLLLIAKLNTIAHPNPVKIYSDYTIDFKLTGDFNYYMQVK